MISRAATYICEVCIAEMQVMLMHIYKRASPFSHKGLEKSTSSNIQMITQVYDLSKGKNQILELLEIRSAKPSYWVPALSRVPVSTRNNTTIHMLAALGVDPSATIRGPISDVVQGFVTNGVQERVEEAQGRLAGAQTGVIQQSDNTGDDWRSSGGTTREILPTAVNDFIPWVQAVCGDVWEATALEVGVLRVVLLGRVGDAGEVCLHCGFLVPGATEVVGETAG